MKLTQTHNSDQTIKSERLEEVVSLIEHRFGDSSSVLQTVSFSGDRFCGLEPSPNPGCILLESILKTAFDGTTQKVVVAESEFQGQIYFIDENDIALAKVVTAKRNLIGLKHVLDQLSWTIDDEGNNSPPIFFYRFEKEVYGAASFSPRSRYPDGTIVTFIEIFHTLNPFYIQHYINQDKRC